MHVCGDRCNLRAYDATQAYAVSKLANVLHTKELAVRLKVRSFRHRMEFFVAGFSPFLPFFGGCVARLIPTGDGRQCDGELRAPGHRQDAAQP
jgi:hypothetical protein